MDYNKEVTTGKDAKILLLEGINELAKAVLATMGPNGRTVIIQDEYGKPYVTKDGVSVANAIKFRDPIKNIAATLIKEVAQKTADEAGDGTTTSICLAQSFIKIGLKLLEDGASISELQHAIDKLTEDTIKHLQKNSKKLNKKDVKQVATISANNDANIGALIQRAYNHSSNVKVEEGRTHEDKIEMVDGMTHEISYMSNVFVNNEKRKEFNVKNPFVITCDYVVGDLQPFESTLQACAIVSRPVVFIVEDMSEACLKILERFIYKGQLEVCAIKAPGFGQYRKDHIKDIATFTNSTLISNHSTTPHSSNIGGKAERLVASKLSTIITRDSSIDVTEAIKDLEIQKKEAKLNDYDREFVNIRIGNLTGSMAVISVGGNSEVEMRERKDRIDDSVLAVKSALQEGIVEGGGIALVRAYNTLLTINEDLLYRSIIEVLQAPYSTIFTNSDGKINTEYYSDRFKEGVIDPLKVTRCALENAASVAKTILSTEAVVLNESLWR